MGKKFVFWKVSLIITLFVFWILVVLTWVLNVFAFLGWYEEQQSDAQKLAMAYGFYEDIFEEVFEEVGLGDGKKKISFDELGVEVVPVETLQKDYEHVILDIYKTGDRRVLVYELPQRHEDLIYDITAFVHHQQNLLRMSGILVIVLTLLSFLIANLVLSRYLLKDALVLSSRLEKIDVGDIGDVNLTQWISSQPFLQIAQVVQRLLQRVKKVNESLKSFNRQVAHEFKTPLMVMASELEYLALKSKNTESLDRIRFQLDKLDKLLDAFLLLTRIETRENQPEEVFDLEEVVGQVIKDLLGVRQNKPVKMDFKISRWCKIKAPKELLAIALKNILDNAFKYTPEGGMIRLEADCEKVVVENDAQVKDEDVSRWFELFARGDSLKPWEGIGLYIVQKIEIASFAGWKVDLKLKNNKVVVELRFTNI